MDGMTLKEEWVSSILKDGTKRHHERGLRYFEEFMGMSPESIVELRKKEPNFETRVIHFFKWLKEKKGLTENSARSDIIAAQSFLRYVKQPIDIRHKLPDISMRLDSYKVSLEDLQTMFRFGDLEIKAWISLSRDCCARVGDLLDIISMPNLQPEMLIKSKKENVVGKVYLTQETLNLLKRVSEGFPKTQQGVDKLLQRACRNAEIHHKINQHLLRKLWISTAINLGLNDTIIKIQSFKAVDKDILTYFLDKEDLRTSWEKVIQALPLEPKNGNGRISKVEEVVNVLMEIEKQRIMAELKERGIAFQRDMDTMELLKYYISMVIEKRKEDEMS